jgi:hypothetical protein
MRTRIAMGATLASLLLCGVVLAGEVKSGPQKGQPVAAFHPLNVFNADDESANGTKRCLV